MFDKTIYIFSNTGNYASYGKRASNTLGNPTKAKAYLKKTINKNDENIISEEEKIISRTEINKHDVIVETDDEPDERTLSALKENFVGKVFTVSRVMIDEYKNNRMYEALSFSNI